MAAIFKSSVLIVLGTVPVTVLIATMAGFALGQLRVVGGRGIFLLLLLGLTLPFEGIIVPLYYEIWHLGFLDTRWAIILPLTGLFMPFGVFWMRAHFVNMPDELTEAARIDGATTWQLFWGVHVPLARPALVSLAILTTVWTWNQFLLAIVLVNNPLERTMAGNSRRLSGRLGHQHPPSLGRLAANPRADDHHLLRFSAPLHLCPAPGIPEGLDVAAPGQSKRHPSRPLRLVGASIVAPSGQAPLALQPAHTLGEMTLRLADKWVWDFWLIQERSEHHIFYLQAPRERLEQPVFTPPPCLYRPRGLARFTHMARSPRRAPARHQREAGTTLRPGPGARSSTTAAGTCSIRESAAATKGLIQRIGLAVSDDLINWVKHPGNPVLEADPRWYDLLRPSALARPVLARPLVVPTPWRRLVPLPHHGKIPAGRSPTPPAWSVTLALPTSSPGKSCRR